MVAPTASAIQIDENDALLLRLPNRPAQRSVTPVAFQRFTIGAGILMIRAVFAPSSASERQ
jgi:hypothetical protein